VRIQILPKCVALIYFYKSYSAFIAQQCLNNITLPNFSVKIRLSWYIPEESFESVNRIPKEPVEKEEKKIDKLISGFCSDILYNQYLENDPLMKGKIKYTCRFEIQIENDKEFQVARKIIGSKVIFIRVVI